MAARQNIIVVIPKGWTRVRNILVRIQPLVSEWMGPLRTLSIQDFSTGSTKDIPIIGVAADEGIPEVSENSIIALYPDDPTRGAVLALHEGSYDLIILAIGLHGPAVDRLNWVWRLVGDEAHAVLVGEELEVEDSQIVELLRVGELPSELNLCDAAIVKVLPNGQRNMGQELPYGGRLLLRE